jgi:hypothetical protein
LYAISIAQELSETACAQRKSKIDAMEARMAASSAAEEASEVEAADLEAAGRA